MVVGLDENLFISIYPKYFTDLQTRKPSGDFGSFVAK
jgi:hypothetical protein